MGITAEGMAESLSLGLGDYLSHEAGDSDFSFSFLYNAAGVLGVDVVDLLSGESPKLTKCAVVRKGEGYDIARRKAYDYKHLAFTFRDKKAEPFLVTVEGGDGKAPTLHSHAGQEFNYMLSGSMEFLYGDAMHALGEGDSAYFDSGTPHAMRSVGGEPARFIAIVLK